MKKIFFIPALYLMVLLVPMNVSAQDAKSVSDKVEQCIQKADANQLASMFNQRVDLEIPGSEGIYSKTQATMIISDFFGNCKSTTFEHKHHGSSGDGATYTIGKLGCSGKSYRVYFLLKKSGDTYRLNQLRFEPES